MRAILFWTLAAATIGWSWWLDADPPLRLGLRAEDARPADPPPRRVWICPVASVGRQTSADWLELYADDSAVPGLSTYPPPAGPCRMWADLAPCAVGSLVSGYGPNYLPPRYLLHGVVKSGDESPAAFYQALQQLESRALDRPVTFARRTTDVEQYAAFDRLLDQELELDIVEAGPEEFLQQLLSRLPEKLQCNFDVDELAPPKTTLVGRVTLRQALVVARLATNETYTLLGPHLYFHDSADSSVGPDLCRLYPLPNSELRTLLLQQRDQVNVSGGAGLIDKSHRFHTIDARWEQLRQAEDQALRPVPPPICALPAQARTLTELAREVARQTGAGVAVLARDFERRPCEAAEAACETSLRQALDPWKLTSYRLGSLLIAYNPRKMAIIDQPEFLSLSHLATPWAENRPSLMDRRTRRGVPLVRDTRSISVLGNFLQSWCGYAVHVGTPGFPGVVMQPFGSDPLADQLRRAVSTDSPLARLARALHFGPRRDRPAALGAALTGDDLLAMAFAIDRIEPAHLPVLRPAMLQALASGRLAQAELYGPTYRLVSCFEKPPASDLLAALDQMAAAAPLSSTPVQVLANFAEGDDARFMPLYARVAPRHLETWKDHPHLAEMLERTLLLQEVPAARDGLKELIVIRQRSLQWVHCSRRATHCLVEILLELLRDSDPVRRRLACLLLLPIGEWPDVSPEHRQAGTLALERLLEDPFVSQPASQALLLFRRRP